MTMSQLDSSLLIVRTAYRQLLDEEQAKPEPFLNTVTSLKAILTGIDTALRWNNIYRQVALGEEHLELPEPQFYEED